MRRKSLTQVAGGSDTVLAGCPVPPGGRLTQAHINISAVLLQALAIEEVVEYGVAGYLLPVLDPDSATGFNTIWDTLVPKDDVAADDTIDLDTGTSDTTPFAELGEVNMNAVLGIDGVDSVEFFRNDGFISYASNPQGFHKDTTLFYLPAVSIRATAKRGYATEQPAVALLGFASPVLGQTQVGSHSAPSKSSWGMMMFLESTITDMMKLLFSLPEAGAESPYEEASAFITDLLEPVMTEETNRATDWLSTSWDVNTKVTFQVFMPDLSSMGNLSSQ